MEGPLKESSRASGILLHPTSLPGPFGIGDLGPEAYRFVHFLEETGQSYWQVLPVIPTGYGNSPYMCFSAFAGNPYLISPEKLAEEGLLDWKEIQNSPAFPAHRVDYEKAIRYKMALLRKSFSGFERKWKSRYPRDFFAFSQENSFWLDDCAFFMALKERHGGDQWTEWAEPLARREPGALIRGQSELSEEIQFRRFVRVQFFKQWESLLTYCHDRGVQVIGDIPVYVAQDSAEVWAHRELFLLDDGGRPLVVAGVPPDYFSATGQRWGNPLYHWKVMAEHGFRWWISRFRFNFSLFDLVRLDHFRGFQAYWEVPASEPTAVHGKWMEDPGIDLFATVKAALGEQEMIAEELGVITPEVDNLRDQLHLPGMRVLQMAFGSDPKASEYRPHNHVPNLVVYTATHDHNTTVGWFHAQPGTRTTQTRGEVEEERKQALKYLGTDGHEIHWDFIRLAMGSVVRMAIFPLQDVLGLGAEARMNLPGTLKGNWEWRFTADMLTPTIRERLREITAVFERSRHSERAQPGEEYCPEGQIGRP